MLSELLESYDFILASSSPRRYEIIHDILGIDKLDTMKPSFEEDLDKSKYTNNPIQYVIDTCKGKADGICDDLKSHQKSFDKPLVVICADTIVLDANNKIYEKPSSRNDLIKNLHWFCYETKEPVRVVTAVSVIVYKSPTEYRVTEFHDQTDMYFDSNIPSSFIEEYSRNDAALNAAGGIMIQTSCGAMVNRIDGDYYNIMGLPLNKLVIELNRLL